MDCFRIDGPVALAGSVAAAGSKNAALPILAASLLAERPVELRRVPRLGDVAVMLRVLACLGAEISPWYHPNGTDSAALGSVDLNAGNALAVTVPDDGPVEVPSRLARAMRASFCVLGPLLARRGRAVVPLPGGCRIGPRPIDLHLAGLTALGADLSIERDRVVARAGRLRGATVDLSGPHGSTVTGTANILSAATRARGKTVILGAACEPEIVDLGRFLQSLGARIEGLGSPVIEISGVDRLVGAHHTITADRIEAATLLLAGAITGRFSTSAESTVRVTDVAPGDLTPVLAALRAVGFDVAQGVDWVAIRSAGRPLPARLVTAPHPGLPTDVQAQFTALLALAVGRSTVRDDIFPQRFRHVAQLRRFGGGIAVQAGTATIDGCRSLHAATVVASDLRASSALVLAALAAEGRSTVRRIDHLDRGYESLDVKLRSLGARIERVPQEPADPRAARTALPASAG
ncbi:MAG TPA: UDP-N-acetylglucosamine 1-carboxyvinyltransferase [Pirellulales bacterium]|jgi:UDP-N-acetylglucosamine 1-carboxyvinyltransferase|nr:UDP-N-acetylglucosamine 1-carboxyvinyltransferase [Pirellulales bacterium]